MKFFLTTALSLLIAGSAFANDTVLFSCERPAERPGRISGHAMIISAVDNGSSYRATLYPICITCRVIPTLIELPQKSYDGTLLLFTGATAQVRISLESLLPTKTHPATLVRQDGTEEHYTCEAQ